MPGLPIGLVRPLALASPEEDEPAGPCDVCNNPGSRPLYVHVCNQAGGTDVAKSGIAKLCAAISPAPDGTATLLAIGDVLVTWTATQLNAFFSDITAPQGVSPLQHVTHHVAGLDEGMVRAWRVLYTLLPGNLRHFATDIEHLRFSRNRDVQNALVWIKNNRPTLFANNPELTPGEIIALNHYTTGRGNEINTWLRHGMDNSVIRPTTEWSTQHGNSFLKFLDDSFLKLEHYSSIPILLRGEVRLVSEMNTWSTGTVLDYPSFISTAKNATGDYFDAGGFSHNVIFNVNNNGNVKVINLETFSQAETELEVLVIRGCAAFLMFQKVCILQQKQA